MGAEATTFLEAGPRTIRPLEQRGGGSGSGGPTDVLDGKVVMETEGIEPMDEPGAGVPEPLGEQDTAADGEEGRSFKGLTAPMKVSREERDSHELTHTPVRWWCRHCVRGRGRNKAHRRKAKIEESKEKRKQTPRVCMDYFFGSQVDEEAKTNPLVVMVDEVTVRSTREPLGARA